eukprot:6458656-Lingulodinium_polyedra.AAC.1
MVSLESLVDYSLADRASDYHLGGSKKLQAPALKLFVLVCGMASYVPDFVLRPMLEGPRAGLQ